MVFTRKTRRRTEVRRRTMVGKRLSINDERLMINDFVHTENTEENGGPQADGGGERQLENNKYPQMSQMDTD